MSQSNLIQAVDDAEERVQVLERQLEKIRADACAESRQKREATESELQRLERDNAQLEKQIAALDVAQMEANFRSGTTTMKIVLPWVWIGCGVGALLIFSQWPAAAISILGFFTIGALARSVGSKK
jgi:hypothetical protein